ncbi:hypothetical protein STEG23_015442 [Scotinomys teguina]
MVGRLAGEYRDFFGPRTLPAQACLVRLTDAAPRVCKGCGRRGVFAHALCFVRTRFLFAVGPGNAVVPSAPDAPLAAPLTYCYAGFCVAQGNPERPPLQRGTQARQSWWLAAGVERRAA